MGNIDSHSGFPAFISYSIPTIYELMIDFLNIQKSIWNFGMKVLRIAHNGNGSKNYCTIQIQR